MPNAPDPQGETSNTFPLLSTVISQTLGGTKYSSYRQKLNDIIKDLRDCGLEEVIKLPKIAVIGNQSAGKSSLIEAISRVKLPRASGTCTRCPMEVVLRSAGIWHCKVSLRIDDCDVSGQERGVFEFEETSQAEEVANILRRAQLAILNPSSRLTRFYGMDTEECAKQEYELKFSKNTVVMEITGAGVDVGFIDLPGIISSTEKAEDERYIELIKDLVTSYVSQPECLILVAISMKDDVENQSAFTIAREHDKTGARTIGVLTKADTVQEGEHENWFKILNGQSYQLHHGYFATRLPSAKEMDWTWEKVCDKEKNFFKSTKGWCDLDKRRLGHQNLLCKLSDRLSEMIEEILPTLKTSTLRAKNETRHQLEKLPKSMAENPQSHLLSLFQSFFKDVEDYTSGFPTYLPEKVTFSQDAKPFYNKLQGDINDTKPNFIVQEAAMIHSPSPDAIFVPLMVGSAQPLAPPLPSSLTKSAEKPALTLDYVNELIEKASVRELFGVCPFKVHETLIGSFLSKWEAIVLHIFDIVTEILETKIDTCCHEHFARFQTSGLHREVTTSINENFRKFVDLARKEIHVSCLKEWHRPFTMMKSEYIELKEKKRNEFLRQRHPQTADGASRPQFSLIDYTQSTRSFPATNENLSKVLASFGIYVNSPTDLICFSTDKYLAELDVMAHVAAYFVVSSRRFVDDIPRVFETVFASDFGKHLRENLIKDLNLVGETGMANCQRFVRDEPHIEEKRERLIRTLGILDKAKETIDRFFK